MSIVTTAGPGEPIEALAGEAMPLPERVAHGSARSILLTLLGEFVLHSQEPVWTATFLYVLEGVEIAEKSARQAIMRSASAGWIENTRDGRRTRWALTESGRSLIASGSERLRSLQQTEWDGNWLILHLPLPDTRKSLRVKVYRALSWLGFGSPSTALWINPHTHREADTATLLADLRLQSSATAFVGRSVHHGTSDFEMASRAWDMPAVLAHYRALTASFGSLRPHTPDEILFAHVRLVNQLQRLPFIDPGLPGALLPRGSHTGDYAAKLFDIRRSWQAGARARWLELAVTPPAGRAR